MEAAKITLGRRVHIAENAVVFGGGEFKMEDYSCLGYSSIVMTATDTPLNGFKASGPMIPSGLRNVVLAEVVVKMDAFVGPICVIYPGIEIGNGAVVTAAASSQKASGEWAIVSGKPARIKAEREHVKFPDC